MEAQGERLHAQLRDAEARVARAEAELEAARALHEQTRAFLTDAQPKLSAAFHEVASKLFDEKSMALDKRIQESGEASKLGIEGTLKPFADQLGQFRERIEAFSSEQGKERSQMLGALNQLRTLNQNMAEAAGNLTRALKGNAKVRGDWGEMILETVLKASGLVEGANYLRQGSARDEEGRMHRPDVVILLPDGRRVVVDSKVSLVAWAEANESEVGADYEDAMQRHANAIRIHLRDLADKNYPKVLGPEALELTVMFVPIEGAMAAALARNPELQTEAFQRKIAFASPNTLMALLTVVERMWTRDKLQKQVGLIGEDAGKVLDAVTAFLDDFDKLGMHLQRAGDAFTASQRRLRDSDQSVVARTRRLVEQGAKGKKLLREELQPTTPSSALPLLLEDAAEEPKLL
jgi:DNA recombination protein RmuC